MVTASAFGAGAAGVVGVVAAAFCGGATAAILAAEPIADKLMEYLCLLYRPIGMKHLSLCSKIYSNQAAFGVVDRVIALSRRV